MVSDLRFNDIEFDVVDRDSVPWLQGRQISEALGYADENSIRKIYERNRDEFTDEMTATVKMTVGITPVDVRIFSPRGCWLIGMFARTVKAKAFRKWVLDVLEREALPEANRRTGDGQKRPAISSAQGTASENTPVPQPVESNLLLLEGELVRLDAMSKLFETMAEALSSFTNSFCEYNAHFVSPATALQGMAKNASRQLAGLHLVLAQVRSKTLTAIRAATAEPRLASAKRSAKASKAANARWAKERELKEKTKRRKQRKDNPEQCGASA